MAAQPPEELSIDPQALTVLEAVVTAAKPSEGCALLLGSCGSRWHVQRIWPLLNVWPEPQERHRRFQLDPREQLLAQRWARQQGLQVLGCAHSHPSSPPVPSETDRRCTLPPPLLPIAGRASSTAAAGPWYWACWWLPEADPGEPAAAAWPVPWRMGPDPLAASVSARPLTHASP